MAFAMSFSTHWLPSNSRRTFYAPGGSHFCLGSLKWLGLSLARCVILAQHLYFLEAENLGILSLQEGQGHEGS
jgi:hypothetical protein